MTVPTSFHQQKTHFLQHIFSQRQALYTWYSWQIRRFEKYFGNRMARMGFIGFISCAEILMMMNLKTYLKGKDNFPHWFFSSQNAAHAENLNMVSMEGNWIFLSRLRYWDHISARYLLAAGADDRRDSNGSGSVPAKWEITRPAILGSSTVSIPITQAHKMWNICFFPCMLSQLGKQWF